MTPFKTILITAAFAIAGLSGTAHAFGGAQQQSIRVSYADLNLDSDQGAKAFLKRVGRAAERACGGTPASGPIELRNMKAFNACKAEAMSGAVAQANNTLVSVRFAEAQGRVYALASR